MPPRLPAGISKVQGSYRVRLYVDDRQHSLGTFATLTDAKAALDIARSEKARGTFVPPAERRRQRREQQEREAAEALSVADLAEQWLAHLEQEGRAASTVVTHRSTLRVHIVPVLGDVQVTKVTPGLIQALLDDIPNSIPRRNAGRTMQTMFNFAARPREDGGVLDGSPFRATIARPKVPTGRIDRDKIATRAEVEALTAAMPPELALAVPIGAWLCLRIGEVLGLERGDFAHLDDPSRAEVLVQRQVNPKANALTPPKWESVRTLALPAFMLSAIHEHLDTFVRPATDAPIFAGHGIGGRVSQSQMDRVWRGAREQVKSGFKFHDLRHSGLTHFAQAGATLAELLQRGGHTDVSVALRYQTATAARERVLTDQMEAALFSD